MQQRSIKQQKFKFCTYLNAFFSVLYSEAPEQVSEAPWKSLSVAPGDRPVKKQQMKQDTETCTLWINYVHSKCFMQCTRMHAHTALYLSTPFSSYEIFLKFYKILSVSTTQQEHLPQDQTVWLVMLTISHENIKQKQHKRFNFSFRQYNKTWDNYRFKEMCLATFPSHWGHWHSE
jgi:hypothetical protein